MKFQGRILIHNDGAQVRVLADNRGESPGVLTHCMFTDEAESRTSAFQNGTWVSHDDSNYGHTHTVPAHGTTSICFGLGESYVRGRGGASGIREHVPIGPGAFLRVGFRNRAWTVVAIPASGEAVEVPYERLTPNVRSYIDPLGWDVESIATRGVEPNDSALAAAEAALKAADALHVVQGKAKIEPIATRDRPNQLAGWKVSFVNDGVAESLNQTTGFIGTVTLLNDEGHGKKNAGLGLESMACPGQGYSASQVILAEGDYGLEQFGIIAKADVPVRLGIRGWSYIDTRLPSLEDGAVEIDLAEFTKANTERTPEWFQADELMLKLGEKKGSVDFFHGDTRINDSLPDTVYAGEDAFVLAEFKTPPLVRITREDDGFHVHCKSELPAADELGPIEVSVAFRMRGEEIPARGTFDDENRTFAFIIPPDRDPAAGETLEIDTGALGWRGALKLPESGSINSYESRARMLDCWKLHESSYKRAGLIPRKRPSQL